MIRYRTIASRLGLIAFAGGLAGTSLAAAQAPESRPPAPTLSAPASPSLPADEQGFLRRWLVLEPIPTTGALTQSAVRDLLDRARLPGALTDVPRAGDTVVVGGTELKWHAVDTSLYNVNLYHFAWALNLPTSNVLFWAVTVVDVPEDLVDVRLAIGSNAASVWWVDGREVIDIYDDRQTVIDDGVSDRLTLAAGRHVILGAVVNGGGATDFCARLLDANDEPITNVRVVDVGQ